VFGPSGNCFPKDGLRQLQGECLDPKQHARCCTAGSSTSHVHPNVAHSRDLACHSLALLKMYSLLIGSKEKKTGKGIHKGFLQKHISHADYVRCLSSEQRADQQQRAKFNTIRSAKHVLGALTINKVGLCCFDNKRYLLDPVSMLLLLPGSTAGHRLLLLLCML
jgi:hypothetical protein